MEYTQTQWIALTTCALLVGVAKTGVPGIGIIVVPLMAICFPAKASTGMLLPLLAVADIFAVSYYRRHAEWRHVLKLLPWALLGIGAGSIVIRHISDSQLKPLIGFIILAILVVSYLRSIKRNADSEVPKHWTFAAAMGFAAGLTTQLANAAGPIMIIYLLAMRLPKNKFIGTGAWYFLILNWLKIPLFILDGRITMNSVATDIYVLPFIFIGALIGIAALKKIPQKSFETTVRVLAILAALRLLLSYSG
ncbi:MAG: sulfite exporter TauE/SafE family protein [Victivallales bacterium]|nr:sulfite exporter TauE/SafE family protein [Victivallales bacterium]